MPEILASFDVTISASAVAWYGAIVATVSVAVAAYNVWRDRTHLQVTARPNMTLTESVGNFGPGEPLIAIEAANTGRRPIVLGTVWFETTDQKGVLFVKSDWEPTNTLSEGTSATMLVKQAAIELAKLRRVVVIDATGRHWRGRVQGGRMTEKQTRKGKRRAS